MTTLQEIKSAKECGRLIRKAREKQGQKLVTLSSKCNLSLSQLVAIEDGNFYAFHNSQNEFNHASRLYADLLGIDTDIEKVNSVALVGLKGESDCETFIPSYLTTRV